MPETAKAERPQTDQSRSSVVCAVTTVYRPPTESEIRPRLRDSTTHEEKMIFVANFDVSFVSRDSFDRHRRAARGPRRQRQPARSRHATEG